MHRICFVLLCGGAFDAGAATDAVRPEWTTREGGRIRAELVRYSWADRSLILRKDGEGEMRMAAQDLDGRGKVRLLFAEPFQDCVMAHRQELAELPAFRERLEWLRRWGVILSGVSVAGVIAISWFLSRFLLRRASLGGCLLVTALAIGLGVAGGWVVFWGRARLGAEHTMELAGLMMAAHAVLLMVAIRLLKAGGLLRAFFWWAGQWTILLVWPVVVLCAAIASQIQIHGHGWNESAVDRYLGEVWLVPMGLI
ncbi:MAG: hypothetical protein KGS60_09270 [Verrucomicrobia bacterium]|nr:hypothetical protein [Verrucomicrobiota bacterium]